MLLFSSEAAFTQSITLTRYPYIQRPTTNSVLIAWKTDSLSISAVEYGLTPSLGSVVTYTALEELHGVEITGLEPETTYYYRVSSQVSSGEADSSEVENFHTNNDTSHPSFDFMIFGDMGDGGPAQFEVRDMILTLDFDLAILTGDIVYTAGEWEYFDPKYFVPYKDIIKNTAFYPSLGNHDVETEDGAPYIANFFLPNNNPDSLEYFYSFDYGKTHFICLDLNAVQFGEGHLVQFDTASTQYAWLQSDLEAASAWADFIIPFFHHPAFSSAYAQPLVKEIIVPLLEEFDVDIVFTGHDHFYERWYPINGVTQVITGGGGRDLNTVSSLPGIAYNESVFHVVLASIQDKNLSFKMIRTDGTVGDSAMVFSATLLHTKIVQEEHTFHSLSVTAPFLKDRNGNSTCTLEYKLSLESVWTSDSQMVKGEDVFTATILNLTPNTEYDIRVTYADPDGVLGESVQTIENILTTSIFTSSGAIFASFTPSSILATAEYFGDGNNNATANLEYKLSTDSPWIDNGEMVKDSLHNLYTLSILDIILEESYDLRVTFTDPDGIEGDNPVTQTGFRNILQSHRGSINIDGSLDDWVGIRPAQVDTWVLDGMANEYIWRDSIDDDLGDGGDAPNASDNPEPYTYPTGTTFTGTEGDIEEFRVAYDDSNFYFLIVLAGSPGSTSVPFSIILIDKDGTDSGRRNVESKTEVNLGTNHAWDFKITANNGNIIVFDTLETDVSTGSLLAQNLSQNFIEISVPVSTLGNPMEAWSFALLQTLGSINRVTEIVFSATNSKGGGGIDGLSDPDIYDLIGASGDAQYTDLNNYTDSTYTVLSNSWVNVAFSPMIIVGVDPSHDIRQVPKEFKLLQNYPNPFNPVTRISYDIIEATNVTIRIYDLLGHSVKTLVNERKDVGFYTTLWNGLDQNGSKVASGVYFYRLETERFTATKKMLLLK